MGKKAAGTGNTPSSLPSGKNGRSSRISRKSPGREENGSRINRHKGNYTWSGIQTESYKPKGGSWLDIARNVLIGNQGETARFHFRYFEIAPGGFSSLEQHRHEHVVVCIRGKGKVRMGRKRYTLGYLDTVYIAPDTIHQLSNPFHEPFGFFCVVNARRDKPKLIRQTIQGVPGRG
ncbi:MAG: cupin domain-containing protein [Alphaproteobacteria bacterium]|uniref:Cupin domain-containing protein n=1 Tax=Candidatus Nitrobium versatile TaxID=2884831 RepID=A0A953M1C0_9BACT|nr:cupin domain-containing protein [Candidatus Nitrobium versatile]